MSAAAIWTVLVIVLALAAMGLELAGPDTALLAALLSLVLVGVLDPGDALHGFANEGMLTVATLYVVAAGLTRTGVVHWFAQRVLGQPSSTRGALARLLPSVTLSSAIVNNTAVVASLLPAVQSWALRRDIDPAKILLPLSYASILGGTCTLVGTSTNLIVAGLVAERTDEVSGLVVPTMFSMTPLGGAAALLGVTTMVLVGHRLFPTSRADDRASSEAPPLTGVLMIHGALDGCTLAKSGLLTHATVQLRDVWRGDMDAEQLEPRPELELQSGDRLTLVGDASSLADLRRLPGLRPARRLPVEKVDRQIVHAVVARRSSLVGRKVGEVPFGDHYRASVLAVSLHEDGSLRDHTLQPGDILLLEAVADRTGSRRSQRDFAGWSPLDARPPRRRRARVAGAVLVGFVAALGLGVAPVIAAAAAAAGMIATGSVRVREARAALDGRVLLAIAAAIGLGRALERTGLDEDIAQTLLGAGLSDPRLALVAVYLLTTLTTEMVTNNAAAVLALPIALSLSDQLGVSPMPFVYTVVLAASCAFLTPIGYQTNLMVYGPGGYRTTDYLRSGLPFTLITLTTAVVLAPILWPFHPGS